MRTYLDSFFVQLEFPLVHNVVEGGDGTFCEPDVETDELDIKHYCNHVHHILDPKQDDDCRAAPVVIHKSNHEGMHKEHDAAEREDQV